MFVYACLYPSHWLDSFMSCWKGNNLMSCMFACTSELLSGKVLLLCCCALYLYRPSHRFRLGQLTWFTTYDVDVLVSILCWWIVLEEKIGAVTWCQWSKELLAGLFMQSRRWRQLLILVMSLCKTSLYWCATYSLVASTLLSSFGMFSCSLTDLIIQDDIFSLTSKGVLVQCVFSISRWWSDTLCAILLWPFLAVLMVDVVEFSLQPHMCLQEMVFIHVCVSDMKVMIWCSVSNSCKVFLWPHSLLCCVSSFKVFVVGVFLHNLIDICVCKKGFK